MITSWESAHLMLVTSVLRLMLISTTLSLSYFCQRTQWWTGVAKTGWSQARMYKQRTVYRKYMTADKALSLGISWPIPVSGKFLPVSASYIGSVVVATSWVFASGDLHTCSLLIHLQPLKNTAVFEIWLKSSRAKSYYNIILQHFISIMKIHFR